MLQTRVMPCLLLKGAGLVKTVKFAHPTYVGDPINAVRIYNEKEVDELVLLDITATREGHEPPFRMISEIASECFMPLAYGGGIRTLDQIEQIFKLGVEKVCINTQAHTDPALIRAAAARFGSQSIVVAIDVKKSWLRGYGTYVRSGTVATGVDPLTHARQAESYGAGELLVNSIDRDGTMAGYDLDLVRLVAAAVEIPVIACGGAGSVDDFATVTKQAGASAAAAGSLFVFHGKHRAVLINYPARSELETALD